MESIYSYEITINLHLILLGESQVVVSFQQLDVLSQLVDGDRRMAHHSCVTTKDRAAASRGGSEVS